MPELHFVRYMCYAGGFFHNGVALQHYRCHTIVVKSTRAAQISDTVEFRHHHLTHPTITTMDRIFHGMNKLTCDLHDAPHIACNNQLFAIEAIHQAIQRWTKTTRPPQTKPHCTTLPHMRTRQRSILRPMRRPQEDRPPDSPPRVVIPKPRATPILIPQLSIASQDEPILRRTWSRFPTVDRPPPRLNKTTDTVPISRRTRSQTANKASVVTPAQAAQQQYPAKFLQILAMPVLKKNSGQSLQYRQLCKHPKFVHIWNTSYANKLGRLCQGIGQGSKGPKHQHVEGTNTFRLIKFADIPQDRRKKFPLHGCL